MTARHFSLLIAGVCLPLWVLAGGVRAPGTVSAEVGSRDLRTPVQAPRFVQREDVQRDDAWTGRRLTTAELAQLREQVRQQLPGRMAIMTPAELHSTESGAFASAPVLTTPAIAWPVRRQRP